MDYENPYAAPTSEIVAPTGAGSDAELDRREHISTESSIKTLGVLYVLGALGAIIAGATTFSVPDKDSIAQTLSFVLLGLGVLSLVGAIGCFGLKKWLRIPVGICSGIGLLSFPIGTLLNGYFLYLVFGKKGGRVLRDDYKDVIAATPHVKMKTSIVTKVLLGILLVILVFALAAAFLS